MSSYVKNLVFVFALALPIQMGTSLAADCNCEKNKDAACSASKECAAKTEVKTEAKADATKHGKKCNCNHKKDKHEAT